MNTRLETLFCTVLLAVVVTASAQFVSGVERLAGMPTLRTAEEVVAPVHRSDAGAPARTATERAVSGDPQAVNCNAASRA